MSRGNYVGRHRPTLTPSRGRRYVVPVALLSTTVAGGLVVRSAGASTLSPDAAATANVSNAVAGLGLSADPQAVTAAVAGRDGSAESRDSVRSALATVSRAGDTAARVDAKAKADAAAVAKAQARKAAAAKAQALAKARRWVSPLSGYVLTSGFGMRWGKLHPAQDLSTPVGSKVHALSSGTVVSAGWDATGFGKLVRIEYWDGTVSWMAHNSQLLVEAGAKVEPGQVIALSGNTGHSTGPHVHLEIHPGGGDPVPPTPWLMRHGVRL